MPTIFKTKKRYTGILSKPSQEVMEIELKGRIKAACDAIDPQPTDVILDVGCKGGWLEHYLHSRVRRVTASDLDNDFILHHQRKNKLANVTYTAFDATKPFPFPDASFDTVALLEVIEHVPNGTEMAVLHHISRVLKQGGKLVLTTPAWHWFTVLCDPAYWLIGHRHYRAAQIKKMLQKAGFKKINIKQKGGLFDALYILLFYLSRPFHLDDLVERLLRRGIIFEYKQKKGFNHLIVVAEK